MYTDMKEILQAIYENSKQQVSLYEQLLRAYSEQGAQTPPIPIPPPIQKELNPLPSDSAYSGPLVITKGGTYTGNWRSTDAAVPAVTVNTSEPVIIENSNLKHAGLGITSVGHKANLTVRNTRGFGITPTKSGRERRFVNVGDFVNVVVEHCYLEHTAGIYVATTYYGNGSPENTVKIRFNQAKNIDGRIYNGKQIAQFVQFNYRGNLPHAEIAWNEVINEAGNSLVEDNINISNSKGAKDSPILIHDNYIQGAYPLPISSSQYSGGGILTEASEAGVGSAYIMAYDNQLVNLGNYSMGIAGGNNISYKHNRIVNSAKLPDGRNFPFYSSGMWSNDYYGKGETFNNLFESNVIGVNYGTGRNDVSIAKLVEVRNQQSLPGTITPAMEKAEYATWQAKLKLHNVFLGVK
jgi:hypothetical protein